MIHYHLGFSVVRRNSINIYLSLSISDFHQMVSSRYNCQLTVIQSLHTFYQIMVLRIKHHCLPRSYSAIAYLPDSSLHCAILFTSRQPHQFCLLSQNLPGCLALSLHLLLTLSKNFHFTLGLIQVLASGDLLTY